MKPQPKPAARVKDAPLLARFRHTRDQCQICCKQDKLETHHLTDMERHGISRRSDVFENLMRLCQKCHQVKYHHYGHWSKAEMRQHKVNDETEFADRYADNELDYDGEVLWAKP